MRMRGTECQIAHSARHGASLGFLRIQVRYPKVGSVITSDGARSRLPRWVPGLS